MTLEELTKIVKEQAEEEAKIIKFPIDKIVKK